MSLRRFLDCAYAILVEEYQRLGIDLLSAIEKLGNFAVGKASDGQALDTEDPPAATEKEVVLQNQQAMMQLEQMMMGTR